EAAARSTRSAPRSRRRRPNNRDEIAPAAAKPRRAPRQSNADPLQLRRGVARSRGGAARKGAIERRQTLGRGAERGGRRVLLEPFAMARAGDRHDERPARQGPGERELRRGAILLGRELLERRDQRHIALEMLGLEARMLAPAVIRRKARLAAD